MRSQFSTVINIEVTDWVTVQIEPAGSSTTAVLILQTTKHYTLQQQSPDFPSGAMIEIPEYILCTLQYFI
jgi:hypothetical protein